MAETQKHKAGSTSEELETQITGDDQKSTGRRTRRKTKDDRPPWKIRLSEFYRAAPTGSASRYQLSDSGTALAGMATAPFKISEYEEFILKSMDTLPYEAKSDIIARGARSSSDVRLHGWREGEVGRISSQYWMIPSENIDEEYVIDTDAKATADQDMKLAVKKAGGLVEYLKAAVKNKPMRETFRAWWSKNAANQHWLENQFRAADAGKHEWIPSDMLPDVLDFAASKGDVGWVELQHSLRNSTADLIFKPRFAQVDPDVGSDRVLQGHSGALYVEKSDHSKWKPATKGQPAFHTELRTAFDKNKKKSNDHVVAALSGVAEKWIWKDEDVPASVHDTYARKPDGSNQKTAAQLKAAQGTAYNRVMQKFTDAFSEDEL